MNENEYIQTISRRNSESGSSYENTTEGSKIRSAEKINAPPKYETKEKITENNFEKSLPSVTKQHIMN